MASNVSTPASFVLASGQKVFLRPLSVSDRVAFVALLRQLTSVSDEMNDETFQRFLNLCEAQGKMVLVATWTSEPTEDLLATISYWLEPKFSRGGSFAAHIEDVVVQEPHRGTGLGKALVQHVTAHVLAVPNCYKAMLNCNVEKVPFYSKCGFHASEVHMRRDSS